MKFEIDRKRWLRGEGPSLSALLRKSDGKMCCLGFKAKALGIADADITDKGHPRSTRNCEQWCDIAGLDRAAVFEKLSDIYNPFMMVNDDGCVKDTKREERLIKMFADIGDEVTFV